MRLFVAAELPEPLTDALSETCASLRSVVRGRFVGPDLYHVTLAFLGEVPARDALPVGDAVRRACEGHKPFLATLGPLGTFGRSTSAVLWQGFAQGQSHLQELAHNVRSELAYAGFSFDAKRFVPHVTLMRRADVAHGTLPMPCVDTGVINTVTLFSSDLSGERPRYEAVERIHFL